MATPVLTGALTGAGTGNGPCRFLDEDQLAAWYRDEEMRLPIDGSPVRTHVVVNRQRPELGATGTQEELLGALRVPVLVVHGDTGEQEQALAAITAGGAHLPVVFSPAGGVRAVGTRCAAAPGTVPERWGTSGHVPCSM